MKNTFFKCFYRYFNSKIKITKTLHKQNDINILTGFFPPTFEENLQQKSYMTL